MNVIVYAVGNNVKIKILAIGVKINWRNSKESEGVFVLLLTNLSTVSTPVALYILA